MNSDLSSFEDEIYALQIKFILESYEYSVQVRANAAIGMMLERVDELVATARSDTAEADDARAALALLLRLTDGSAA